AFQLKVQDCPKGQEGRERHGQEQHEAFGQVHGVLREKTAAREEIDPPSAYPPLRSRRRTNQAWRRSQCPSPTCGASEYFSRTARNCGRLAPNVLTSPGSKLVPASRWIRVRASWTGQAFL